MLPVPPFFFPLPIRNINCVLDELGKIMATRKSCVPTFIPAICHSHLFSLRIAMCERTSAIVCVSVFWNLFWSFSFDFILIFFWSVMEKVTINKKHVLRILRIFSIKHNTGVCSHAYFHSRQRRNAIDTLRRFAIGRIDKWI